MATRVNLEQSSPDWEIWRNAGIGSSDAPVIMGVSPFLTPFQLYLQKLGLSEKQDSYIFGVGHKNEEIARERYIEQTGNKVEPACFVDQAYEWLKASCDGVNLTEDIVIECKYVGQDDHMKAVCGEVPEKYIPQVQHLLMVTRAERCDYVSFDGETIIIVEVAPDLKYQSELFAKEGLFWDSLQKKTPPALTDKDVVERDDDEWTKVAGVWLETKRQYDGLEKLLDSTAKQLITLSTHPRTEGAGVRVTRIVKKGNVDYSVIPALQGMDLEQFRKDSTIYHKVEAVGARKKNESK